MNNELCRICQRPHPPGQSHFCPDVSTTSQATPFYNPPACPEYWVKEIQRLSEELGRSRGLYDHAERELYELKSKK